MYAQVEDVTALEGKTITPLQLAVLEVVVGVRRPFDHEAIPEAVADLVEHRLVGADMAGQVTPTEAGVRATAPRYMKVIN